MSFIPHNEKIIEKKICRISGQEFFITDRDIEFYEKISPVFAGQKYLIPSPTFSPEERQRRRLSFRNERKLYHRKCDKTGNQIISMYSPDKPYMVYDQKVWWGDEWSPMDYGMKFDFDKPFFGPFGELMRVVPRINLINKEHENSEFCNFATQNKNSYLLFTSGWCENSYYSNRCLQSRNICDCSGTTNSELCYEVIDSSNCFNCKWLQGCHNCSDCTYGYDLSSCKNCLGCYGLTNREFCIGNQEYTPEKYKEKIQNIGGNFSRELFNKHLMNCVRKYANTLNSEDSTGDMMSGCHECFNCFEVNNLEKCKHISNATELKDGYDVDNDDHSELSFEVVGGESNYQQCFCDISWFNRDTWYSSLCFHSSSLFGCVGIKKGKNIILNTSFSQQEYEILCGKIIDHMKSTGEWGEFFPHTLSPFGYNETVAQDYYPLSEDDIRKQGWNWKKDEEMSSYHGSYVQSKDISDYDEKIIGYEKAQENIDALLGGLLQCSVTNRPYKIIRQELAFYIENSIQIPTKHPDIRHTERLSQRNQRKLYERKCDTCGKDIQTTYSPERKEKIACSECYKKLVY